MILSPGTSRRELHGVKVVHGVKNIHAEFTAVKCFSGNVKVKVNFTIVNLTVNREVHGCERCTMVSPVKFTVNL